MPQKGHGENLGGHGGPVGNRLGQVRFVINPPAICPRHLLPMNKGKGGCIQCRKPRKR